MPTAVATVIDSGDSLPWRTYREEEALTVATVRIRDCLLVTAAIVATAGAGVAPSAAVSASCGENDTSPATVVKTRVTPRITRLGTTGRQIVEYRAWVRDNCPVKDVTAELRHDRGDDIPYGNKMVVPYVGAEGDVQVFAATFEYAADWLANDMAGTWTSTVHVYDSGLQHTKATGQTSYLRRLARVSSDASPEPVGQGASVKVNGKLTRANWKTLDYRGYGAQRVELQRRPLDGSYVTIRTLTTDSTGALSTEVIASADACYRYVFRGTDTTTTATSAGDCVDVRDR